MSQADYQDGLSGKAQPMLGGEKAYRDWAKGDNARRANKNLAEQIRGDDTSSVSDGPSFDMNPALDKFFGDAVEVLAFFAKLAIGIATASCFAVFVVLFIIAFAISYRILQ